MERWITIEEAPNYLISDYGRIQNRTTEKILKNSIDQRGYFKVTLVFNGKYFTQSVHLLVARNFVYGERPGLEVNHKDGDKLNNHYLNLEWVTHQENLRHATNLGLIVRDGKKRAVRIIETGEIFESQSACARAIGGSVSGINRYLRGFTTQHRGYTFEYVDSGT